MLTPLSPSASLTLALNCSPCAAVPLTTTLPVSFTLATLLVAAPVRLSAVFNSSV